MAPVYKTGTSLKSIIEDGWMRGFEATQTVEEAQASGYKVDIGFVKTCWLHMTLVHHEPV